MKPSIILLSMFFTVAANASAYDVTVQCKRASGSGCAARTVEAFEKMGCDPIANSISCRDAATDPMLDPSYRNKVKGLDFCTIKSDCHEPNFGSFNRASCNYGTSGEKVVDLRKVSSGITLTVSVGLFQRMVSTLCK